MAHNKKPLVVGLAAVLASLSSIPAAIAQDERAQLEEVIVTARKVGESLQDVPIAVTAFTEATIEDAGIELAPVFVPPTATAPEIESAAWVSRRPMASAALGTRSAHVARLGGTGAPVESRTL